jgi:hypothetical protein
MTPVGRESRALIIRRMRRTRDSTEFRKLAARLAEVDGHSTTATLSAVLLIEMTERPRHVRAVEWTLYYFAKVLPGPARWAPRTLGPLQLRDGPRDFRVALSRASQLLDGADTDEEIARRWYGSAGRQPGSCLSYVEAMSVSRRLLARLPTRGTLP